MTQAQGNDEGTAVAQYKETCEEVMVYLFGFVSGVLVMVLVRFVANYMFDGHYAKSPVICVEVGTQVDLLACDEELVDDLNSRSLQPEENWEMWVHRAKHAHVDYDERRGSRRG